MEWGRNRGIHNFDQTVRSMVSLFINLCEHTDIPQTDVMSPGLRFLANTTLLKTSECSTYIRHEICMNITLHSIYITLHYKVGF